VKVIFFGLGSIGQRQARILLENFEHELFAFRSGAAEKPNQLGIKELYKWEEVEKLGPEIAFITNPTNLHIPTALRCAALGMHLFIEKPLSHTLQDIPFLTSVCQKKGLTCYTAYGLRFHPVIKAMKERIKGRKVYQARVVCSSYLPDWRSGRSSESTYSAYKDQGGGVLLDLSHEFDYIQHLFGEIGSMQGRFGRISSVTKDSEDFADVLLETVFKTKVNLHLDFLSLYAERRIVMDLENGYLVGDLIQNQIEEKAGVQKFSSGRDDYLKEQLRYFFEHLGEPAIMNNIQEAGQLLGKVLELKDGQ